MTEDELRDLAERTQQIASLTDTLGWDLLRDRAHAEVSKHQQRILAGKLSEADYRRECGYVEGALAILALPEAVVREYGAARNRFDEAREQQQEAAA